MVKVRRLKYILNNVYSDQDVRIKFKYHNMEFNIPLQNVYLVDDDGDQVTLVCEGGEEN